jgi:ribosomal protein L40E
MRFSVVIRNLDFIGISCLPSEANTILLIDPDAVLSRSVSAQSLETIPGRDIEFEQIPHPIYLVELSANDLPQVSRASTAGRGGVVAVENVLCAPSPERTYHECHYNDIRYKTEPALRGLSTGPPAAAAMRCRKCRADTN